MKFFPAILFVILTLGISSCKKDKLTFDAIPAISIISVAPTTIQQFQDSVIITLSYQDGDGDLGFVHPDSMSLRVLDSRLTAADWYFVQPLAPLEEELAIEGVLRFKLNGTFLLGGGGNETTTFTVALRDRSNNWSNEVVTPTITITP